MATATTTRTDVYTRVTSHIVEELERGVRPWLKPWNAENAAGRITRPLRHNGLPYNGVNVLMLWASAEMQGYSCPFWLTFQQTKEFGGHIKKGHHGSPVVYASTFKKKEQTEGGSETEADIPFLKEYTVFNAEQCEGLPPHFFTLAQQPTETIERIEQAETFFANTKADIRNGGNQAYYAITGDYVQMPPLEAFRDAESHAATLAHELTHWTRHTSRLNREFGRKRWGDEGYLAELTGLRDQLKAGLSASSHQPDKEEGPSASDLAEKIKALKAANSIEAAPQRARQKHSTAEEPITARIRRRQEAGATDQSVEVEQSEPAPAPEKHAPSFQERILRERQLKDDGQSPS